MSLYQELSQIENPKYQSFWGWFMEHSTSFYQVLKSQKNIETDLIAVLAPKVEELDLGLFFLIGMDADNQAELVFTPDGNIQAVYLAEDLIAVAPQIPNWTFKALKPPTHIPSFEIRMQDLVFSQENISFFPSNAAAYPDEIELTMIYKDYQTDKHDDIVNGVFIFLDNFLGEEVMIEKIDRLHVIGPNPQIQEEIPVQKLPEYIHWREKEFVEKYQDVTYQGDEHGYAGFEASMEDGTPLISTIHVEALNWPYKASHPWILILIAHFQESTEVGMPSETSYDLLGDLDDLTQQLLPVIEGNIYMGRELGDGRCEIYYACKDYRMAAKVADWVRDEFKDRLQISSELFKDKYWQVFERYNSSAI